MYLQCFDDGIGMAFLYLIIVKLYPIIHACSTHVVQNIIADR